MWGIEDLKGLRFDGLCDLRFRTTAAEFFAERL